MTLLRWARPLALLAAGTVAWAGLPMAADAAEAEPPSQFQLDWQGESGGALGYASSRVGCDVNGDGFSDTVSGDWGWDRPGYANTGAGYVLLGSAGIVGGATETGGIANPDSGAVRIDGPSVTVTGGAWVGWSVSCLGDVNGDGYDDIALGSGSRNYQQVSIILGRADFSGVDLNNLGAEGFEISDSTATGNNFGYWVGEVGDVNGDGLDDIGIGDLLADNNDRSNSGRVWIVAGSDSVADVDVTTQPARVLGTIDGVNAEDRLATVASAGDVNGDSTDDLVVSSYTATPWGSDAPVAGAAYVVLGIADAAIGTVDLASLGDRGFAIYGGLRGRDRLGTSVAPAGDVNGDGLADILIGGDGVSNAATGDRNGGVAVVLGSASTATVFTAPESASGYTVFACADGEIDLSCADSGRVRRGYWIDGAAKDSKAGWAVAGTGDVNGDEVPDLVIGASGTQSTWLVYGQASASTKRIDLAGIAESKGRLLAEGFGRSVGSAGDVDGNGVPDLLLGHNTANRAATILLGALGTKVEIDQPATVTVGQESTLTASVKALVPQARPALSGTLSVIRGGHEVEGCTDLDVDGTTEIECDLDTSADGEFEIEVVFTPGDDSVYRTASATVDVTVEPDGNKPVTVSAPVLSATSAVHGTDVSVSATFTDADGDPVTGQASVTENGSVLAQAAIGSDGTVRIGLPRNLSVGSHALVVERAGDEEFTAAASEAVTLAVVKSRTLTKKPKISAPRVKKGKVGTITVRLGKLDNGQYPAGKVRLTYAGKTKTVSVAASAKGTIKVKLPKKSTKTRSVSVRYLGSSTTHAGSTAKAKVLIKR